MIKQTAGGASSVTPSRLESQLRIHKQLFTLALALVLAVTIGVPLEAFAQTTATGTPTGVDFAKGVLDTVYGGWGTGIAIIIAVIGIWVWLRRGIAEGVVVMVAGFSLFFIPVFVQMANGSAKSMVVTPTK